MTKAFVWEKDWNLYKYSLIIFLIISELDKTKSPFTFISYMEMFCNYFKRCHENPKWRLIIHDFNFLSLHSIPLHVAQDQFINNLWANYSFKKLFFFWITCFITTKSQHCIAKKRKGQTQQVWTTQIHVHYSTDSLQKVVQSLMQTTWPAFSLSLLISPDALIPHTNTLISSKMLEKWGHAGTVWLFCYYISILNGEINCYTSIPQDLVPKKVWKKREKVFQN